MHKFFFKGKLLFAILAILILLKIFLPVRNQAFHASETDRHFEMTRTNYATTVPDSLPWRTYKKLEDSIRREFIESNWSRGSLKFAHFGLFDSDKSPEENFIGFNGYHFNDDRIFYFKKNGKKYLTKFDGIEIDRGFTPGTRFSSETELEIEQDVVEGQMAILFPISKTIYNVIYVFVVIVMILALILFLHVCFSLPLRILYNISNGRSFIDENIRSLNLIGRTFIITAIVISIIKLVSHLVILNKLPEFISFDYYAAVMYSWGILAIGLIILIIARAFREGSELKDEQELTV